MGNFRYFQKPSFNDEFPLSHYHRRIAGGPLSGDVFKCALKPVDEALADGTYGDVLFSQVQQNLLNNIFPAGVCDYSKPDTARPIKYRE